MAIIKEFNKPDGSSGNYWKTVRVEMSGNDLIFIRQLFLSEEMAGELSPMMVKRAVIPINQLTSSKQTMVNNLKAAITQKRLELQNLKFSAGEVVELFNESEEYAVDHDPDFSNGVIIPEEGPK